MRIAILTAILIFFGTLAWAQPSKQEIKAHIRECAKELGVSPAFALAVATIESGLKCGPLGRKGTFAGPFGLHRKYCQEHFGIDPLDPEENIRIGVAALRGKSRIKILKRYNKSFDMAYFKAVKQVEAQEQREQ